MTNSLKFNVDESIWFNVGDAVDNILSISLEPDIGVAETGDFVTIKGSLRLDGEYQRAEQVSEQEEMVEQSDEQMAVRSVHEVRKQEENIFEFQHRFPVEITIPKNRVNRLDDIHVTVESFDYRIPHVRNLQMSAELAIKGIQEEQSEQQPDPIENYNFEERVKDIYVHDKTSFVIDSKREEDVTMDLHEMDEIREEEHEATGPQFELKSREEDEEIDEEYKAFESLHESEEETDDILEGEQIVEEEEDSRTDVEVDDIEPHEDADEEITEEKTTRSENALYLTKMLTREEEQFSQLRMRIIQPGDSLDSIAETYELQPTQIARLNHLHDEQVEEGQIIYIPVKATED